MQYKPAQNLFTTNAVRGALVSLIGFIVAIAPMPMTQEFIDRKVNPELAADIKFYLALAVIGGGTICTTIGTYQIGDNLYTPEGLAGRNKEDVVLQPDSSSATL